MFHGKKVITQYGPVLLITEDQEPRSMTVIRAAEGTAHQFATIEEASQLLDGEDGVLAPLFDYRCHFAGMKRWCRFVRRNGKARFPAWTSDSVGVLVYRNCPSTVRAAQIAEQFRSWKVLSPRTTRASSSGKTRSDQSPFFAHS